MYSYGGADPTSVAAGGSGRCGTLAMGQTKITFPHPLPPPTLVFSKGRRSKLPPLRPILGSSHTSSLITLLLSGQCPNPGPPSYPCSVCSRGVTWSRIFHSFKCSSCQQWVHQACCSLRSSREYHSYNGAPCAFHHSLQTLQHHLHAMYR